MLVGLTGKKRSGKDTAAARLVGEHGFRRLAFADPMRDALAALNPWTVVYDDEVGPLAEAAGFRSPAGTYRLSFLLESAGWEGAKGTREVRRLLQHYGTAIRDIKPGFWVDLTMERASTLLAHGESVVITDVRFPDELDAVHLLGGEHWHIQRPGLASDDTHVSETALDSRVHQADAVLHNTGTVADLDSIVDRVYSSARNAAVARSAS